MELRDYLRILRANWVLIVVVTLIGAVASAGYTLLQTPEYQSRTELHIAMNTETQSTGDLTQGANYVRQNIPTYVEVATTDSVLGPVVEELNLPMTAAQLSGMINAVNPQNSSLITITVTDLDPERATLIAAEVGAQLSTLIVEELDPPVGEASTSPIRIQEVQSATEPSAPVSPRTTVNVALGTLVGLALGIGIAVLRSSLDTRVRTTHDVENITGVQVLGNIPEIPKNNGDTDPQAATTNPPVLEAYRTLRTNIQFLRGNEGTRAYVVTSATAGVGKTETAINLARTFADAGMNVALLDCDLRNPKIATRLGLGDTQGLAEVLSGTADISEVLQRHSKKLYVLPAGQTPPNPSELLGSSRMDTLFDTLSAHVDYVLLNAPPLLEVSDAAVVGMKTEGAILVAGAGVTHKQQLQAAGRALHTVGLPFRGIVLTNLPANGQNDF